MTTTGLRRLAVGLATLAAIVLSAPASAASASAGATSRVGQTSDGHAGSQPAPAPQVVPYRHHKVRPKYTAHPLDGGGGVGTDPNAPGLTEAEREQACINNCTANHHGPGTDEFCLHSCTQN